MDDKGVVELDILAIPLTVSGLESEALLVIAEDSIDAPENRVSDCGLGRKTLGRQAADQQWTIRYFSSPDVAGAASIRLLERTQYQIRLCRRDSRSLISFTDELDKGHPVPVDSPLDNDQSAEWKFDPKSGIGRIRVSGHYGGASIRVGDRTVRVDFVSSRLDYDSEYRAMLEDVAGHFQSIVASWGRPTSYPASTSEDVTAETLLEKFILARGILESHRLEYAARAIERIPDTLLERKEYWKPVGSADPRAFLRDPLGKGRNWRKSERDRFPVHRMPEEVKHARSRETADTPANRFVKHVLQRFENIFRRVAEHNVISGSANVEASGLANTITNIVDRPFWKEIGALSKPITTITRNPLLRKREGYRQVFQAWLGFRSSLSVDWDGASELFRGPVRDTSTLYEYWLFLGLRSQISQIDGFQERKPGDGSDAKAFVGAGDELAVRLRGGRASVTEFQGSLHGSEDLCVLLFYNRGFSGDTESPGPGSYSRGWRPDLSAAVFPAEYRMEGGDWEEAEALACRAGEISYVHFEAKYKPSDPSEPGKEEVGPTASDFAELHAYLDGIHGSEAAFLLHPGKTSSARGVQTSYSRHEFGDEVGEIVLRPGPAGGSTTSDEERESDARFMAEVFRNAMEQLL